MPFLKFFPNDWLAEPTIRVCSVAARGLWMDMLSLMHLSPRRGYLLAATGSPISPEQLARLTGCSAEEVTRLLAELHSSGAYSCTDDGSQTIFNRRMVRDESKREKCGDAGRRGGGNPTFKGEAKGDPKVDAKVDANLRSQTPEARDGASHRATDDPSPAAKPPKTRKVADSDHARAIDAFTEAWRVRYGEKYPFNAGKDATAVKWMLNQVGRDEVVFAKVVARYFADDEPFVMENRHTIGLLRAQFARWLVDRPPKADRLDSVTKYAIETLPL